MEDELNILKDILYKYALVEVPSMENEAYIPESNFEEIAKALLTLIRKREEQAHKEGRAEIEKELMAELRDPCGTIWEHAKRLQDENDRLKQQLEEAA